MKWDLKKDALCLGILFALSAALFGFELGKTGLLDPDEPFYSLTAKEMLERGDPSTPFLFGRPQFEKPILFYWVLYAFFKTLGVNEFSARLGPCLAGVATVLVTYIWALALFKRRRAAFLAAFFLATSAQFIILSRIVLTDIFLCLFVTAAFCCFTLGERNPGRRAFYWNGVFLFCALGFLTKGPLGLFIPFSGILGYLVLSGQRQLLKQIPWTSGGLVFGVVALPWYALMTRQYGPGFLEHFFLHENLRRFFVAEHRSSDKLFFYPFVLFSGFFPWSIFMTAGVFYAARRALRGKSEFLFLFISFLAPLIFFNLAKSKLMSYFFPLYPAVALMTAAWTERFLRSAAWGARMRPSLVFGKTLIWGVTPAVLIVGVFIYGRQSGFDLFWPLVYGAASFMLFSWAAFALFLTRRYRAAMVWTGLSAIFLTALGFSWILPKAGEVFSSKAWAQTYRERTGAGPSRLVLASKLFVRGISYYTGDPNVGVFSDKPSGGFYTPHPIRVISDEKQLSGLADNQFPVYLLIREKEIRKLREITGPAYTVSVMQKSPVRSWVRLERA